MYRDLARTPLLETLYRHIAYRSVAKILARSLLHKVGHEGILVRACAEISKIDLAERSLVDILSRGLAKRPLKEICAERERESS